MDVSRDRGAQVQQRIKLDGSLRGMKLPKRKHRQAQIDRGRIQGIDRNRQSHAKAFAGIQSARSADQTTGAAGRDAQVARIVGTGKRPGADRSAQPYLVGLGGLGLKTNPNVARTFPVGDLRERNDPGLLGARPCLGAVIPAVASRRSMKRRRSQKLHEVRWRASCRFSSADPVLSKVQASAECHPTFKSKQPISPRKPYLNTRSSRADQKIKRTRPVLKIMRLGATAAASYQLWVRGFLPRRPDCLIQTRRKSLRRKGPCRSVGARCKSTRGNRQLPSQLIVAVQGDRPVSDPFSLSPTREVGCFLLNQFEVSKGRLLGPRVLP